MHDVKQHTNYVTTASLCELINSELINMFSFS